MCDLLLTSGSTSPSQMIQQLTSLGSFTTLRAASVSTPSAHSRVSMSMWPSRRSLCMDFGFITWVTTAVPHLIIAALSTRQSVDLPHPEGPTTTQPMRWSRLSLSWIIFLICAASSTRWKGFSCITALIASSSSPPVMSALFTPGNTSPMRFRNLEVSAKVSLESVFTRTALIRISYSISASTASPCTL